MNERRGVREIHPGSALVEPRPGAPRGGHRGRGRHTRAMGAGRGILSWCRLHITHPAAIVGYSS